MKKYAISRPSRRPAFALGLALLGPLTLGSGQAARADDPVPPPWHGQDIGGPALPGSARVPLVGNGWDGPSDGPDAGTQLTLTSGGVDIWNTSDQFHFDYYQLTGSGQIVTRVLSQTNTGGWAKAGVMMRNTLDAGSAFADIVTTPANGIAMQRRAAANGSCNDTETTGAAPDWVKLTRLGTTVTGFSAPDNGGVPGAWTSLGTWTCGAGTIYVGLCLTSGTQSAVGTAVFDNIQVTGEQATPADSFVDSIGVNHGKDSTYNAALIGLGIRHVRDGYYSNAAVLSASGVKLTDIAALKGGSIDSQGNPTGPAYNGSISDVDDFRDKIKNYNAATGGPGTTIEAVEGPNEPDLFWSTWYNCTYNGSGSPTGPQQYQQDLYRVLKSDPATAGLPVLGLAWGETPGYGTGFLPPGALTGSVDLGNFHAYPRGSGSGYGQSYDTVWSNGSAPPYTGMQGYTRNDNDPAIKLNYANATFFPAYAPQPIMETEVGYFTGTDHLAVSQNVLAKYVPRTFLEHFNFGIRRAFWYCLDDLSQDQSNSEMNYGLVYFDATPKPAYKALQSLISLLTQGTFNRSTRMWSSPSFTPGNLTYTLAVSPVLNYTEPNSGMTVNYDRTYLVHHLLMQKSSGVYYLALWHEVADGANTDLSGNAVTGPEREIVPPALPTVITLPSTITTATLYSYNANWTLQPTPLSISSSHQISLSVPDAVVVLSLQ